MSQKQTGVFERYEIKYITDEEQRAFIEQQIRQKMDADSHGESTICNVYYDTPDFRLVRRSLEKPIYKEKFRIRSYGQVQGDGNVFIELKKKFNGVVYKRRVEVPYYVAMSYLNGHLPYPEESQIGREIESFRRYYGTLEPAVHLCYDRTAYFEKDNMDVRLTFDRNIRWDRNGLTLTAPPVGTQLLSNHHSLMEVKVGGAIPLWLLRILNEADVKQISYSKYGRAYETGIAPYLEFHTQQEKVMERENIRIGRIAYV